MASSSFIRKRWPSFPLKRNDKTFRYKLGILLRSKWESSSWISVLVQYRLWIEWIVSVRLISFNVLQKSLCFGFSKDQMSLWLQFFKVSRISRSVLEAFSIAFLVDYSLIIDVLVKLFTIVRWICAPRSTHVEFHPSNCVDISHFSFGANRWCAINITLYHHAALLSSYIDLALSFMYIKIWLVSKQCISNQRTISHQ